MYGPTIGYIPAVNLDQAVYAPCTGHQGHDHSVHDVKLLQYSSIVDVEYKYLQVESGILCLSLSQSVTDMIPMS